MRVFQPVAGRLVAVVDDHGPGVDRGLSRRRARYGWRLVEAFCDRVTVVGGRSGTRVRLEIARTAPTTTRHAHANVVVLPRARPRVCPQVAVHMCWLVADLVGGDPAGCGPDDRDTRHGIVIWAEDGRPSG